MSMPRKPSALRAVFFCALRNSMQPVWPIGKLYRTEVPKCNRKLYSLVVSCTHHGKIPAAKSGFVCFADKIGFVFAFLVFSIYLCRLSCTGETRLGKACTGKAVLGQKSPKGREFGAVYGWAASVLTLCERAQTEAFLAATGVVCGAAVAWYFRTISCRRVKLIYRFVGLFLCENLVILVSAFLNGTKVAHLFDRCV